MKIHTVKPHPARPRHATGEIVWATVGNYIEKRSAVPKMRPVVILRPGDCQHWIAGLTTQATSKTTGQPRVMLPIDHRCALCGTSFLWSSRPSYLCRLDVRTHIGWAGHDVLNVIERHMRLPWHVLAELRAAADAMTNTDGTLPAATL